MTKDSYLENWWESMFELADKEHRSADLDYEQGYIFGEDGLEH